MRQRGFPGMRFIIGGVVVVLLLGCSGGKGTSTKSKNYIRFENEFGTAAEVYITLDACHQNVTLPRGESETIECVPEDGSTSFLVTVEMNPGGTGTYLKRECMVSGGQTVTIAAPEGTLNTFYLYVDGELCSAG